MAGAVAAGPSRPPQVSGVPSQEIQISIGHGPVTGSIVLTLSVGQTGVALDAAHLKLLENKAQLALNDFSTKLEGTVLSGGLATPSLDGIQLTFGVSALTLGTQVKSDGLTPSADLLSVDVGLQGDVTHWFGRDAPGVTCTLQGQLQVALGEQLASQLADLAAKEKDERALAARVETAGDELTANEAELTMLEERRARLAASGASQDTLKALDDQILAHRGAVWHAEEEVTQGGKALRFAREAADEAARKVEGPVARQLARVMEHESVKLVAEKLAHVVPVLDAAMLGMDTYQAIRSIYHLAHGDAALVVTDTFPIGTGDKGDVNGEAVGAGKGRHLPPHDAGSAITRPEGGASGTGSGSASGSEAGARAPASPPRGPQAGGAGASTSSRGTPDDTAVARRGLSPAARRLLEAISPRDGTGVKLTPADIEKLGALVPSDLSPFETREVIAAVLRPGARATTAADALQAIESAVRSVRGEGPPAAAAGAPDPGKSTARDTAATDGPITDPRQVDSRLDGSARSPDRGRSAHHAETADWLSIVRSAPPEVISHWFVEDRGELVPSEEFERWKTAHVGAKAESVLLRNITSTTTRISDAVWDVQITFNVNDHGHAARVRHSFFVRREPPSSIGAAFHGLSFEPYISLGNITAWQGGN